MPADVSETRAITLMENELPLRLMNLNDFERRVKKLIDKDMPMSFFNQISMNQLKESFIGSEIA